MTKPEESEMERLCFRPFREKGSWQDLLVLADYVCEHTDRRHFETLLREVAAAANPAVHWFAARIVGSYYPDRETPLQGLLRSAAQYAWIEAAYWQKLRLKHAGKWRFVWEPDVEATDERNSRELVAEDEAFPLWFCRLDELRYLGDEIQWRHVDSRGAIDLGSQLPGGTIYRTDDGENYSFVKDEPAPYARIVQCDLARENLATFHMPDWMKPEDVRRMELVVLRRRVRRVSWYGEIRERQHEWGDLYAILPTCPASESLDDPTKDHKDYCEAFHLDSDGDVRRTSENYRDFQRISAPADPDMIDGLLRAERDDLLWKMEQQWHVSARVVGRAPDGYLQMMRNRREELRRNG